MKLLKTGNDYLEIGYNHINQREYSKAHDSFLKASEKFNRQGNIHQKNLCKSLLYLMAIQSDLKNPDLYIRSKEYLERVNQPELKFGLKLVPISELIDECRLTVDELTVLKKFSSASHPDAYTIAEEIQTIATDFQEIIGERTLYIPELFERRSITGLEHSYHLYAICEEIRAEYLVWSEPKKSVEHFQNASHWRNLLGDKDHEITINHKIHEYSQGAICWFCGREIYGKNVHFLPMKTKVTEFQKKNEKSGLLHSADLEKQELYACGVCYYAITNRIEEITQKYHTEALNEIHRVESELSQQIVSLMNEIRKIKR